MANNPKVFARSEIEAHRRTRSGVTASVPGYKVVDGAGNKEFVVDVYLGPVQNADSEVIKDVPIAHYARQRVTDIYQPIVLEISKEGKLTVIGRAKIFLAGLQTPEQSILEPTYHEFTHNLQSLRLLWLQDLDWTLTVFQATPSTKFQETPSTPFQTIRAFNAFGKQLVGPEAPVVPPQVVPIPVATGSTIHTRIVPAKFGPKGDPLAMNWGVSVFQPMVIERIEVPA